MIQRCVGQSNKIVPGLSLERKTLKPLKQTGTVRLGAGSSAWYAASCKGCWLKNVRFARAFAQWSRYTGRPRVQIPPCPPTNPSLCFHHANFLLTVTETIFSSPHAQKFHSNQYTLPPLTLNSYEEKIEF